MVSSEHSRAILIFSKAAESGRVKTRLRPALSDEGCLRLHLALVQDTLETCAAVSADSYLFVAGDAGFPFSIGVPVHPQVAGDLGTRLHAAFALQLASHGKVLAIGIDAPGVTAELLEDAFGRLNSSEVVLGPTRDGGYYLIGLTRMIPEIFSGIPWSTPQVFDATVSKLREHSCAVLPQLFDVDEPADLQALKNSFSRGDFPHARHTREVLDRLLRP